MMLLSKSLYLLSVVYYATTTALPVDNVEDATVAENRTANQTIATNDHANFQPLLRCDNVYTNIGTPRGNSLVKVPGLQQDLAERIKKRSDDNTCARISGRFNSDITWEYETRTSGSDCKTSANTNAIRDAVRDYLQWMTSNGFDHACVRMSNCGTWKGLLQIADHGKKIQNGRCAGVL